MTKRRRTSRSRSCVRARKRRQRQERSLLASADDKDHHQHDASSSPFGDDPVRGGSALSSFALRPPPPRPPCRMPTIFERFIQAQCYKDCEDDDSSGPSLFLRPEELGAFFRALRRPLPINFRIRGGRQRGTKGVSVRKRDGQGESCFDNHDDDDATTEEAVKLEWQRLVRDLRQDAWAVEGIPGAWQLQPPPSSLSPGCSYESNQHANNTTWPPWAVRSWLAHHTTKSGAISRQELVSMLPVALLQIQSHHAVLDLCASPGSKTVQAVDCLYSSSGRSNRTMSVATNAKHHYKNASNSSPPSPPHDNDDEPPPRPPLGFCVSNELDARRAHILAHRARQTLGTRHAALAVVCHNATKFPNVQAPLQRRQHAADGQQKPEKEPSKCSYDRIICDVPCSGDGTLRKDLKVWKTWHPSYGIALHQLQIRIAKRGIALLKMGGLMTYSTCSFHPVEDEAVVAALLRTGCVQVVPPDDYMPRSLKWRPGLRRWKVLNDECEQVLSHAEAPSDWPATLWPQPKGETPELYDQLQNCVRLFPQDNDTGGFFIALLRKIRDFEPRKKKNSLQPPLLTPIPSHHALYKAYDVNQQDPEDSKHHCYFRRSPCNPRSSLFALTSPLAQHLTETPGCAKINIVSAGYKFP